ncbi:MAG: hypothetical protein ACP5NZ_00360 [Nanobdellota archaeon]
MVRKNSQKISRIVNKDRNSKHRSPIELDLISQEIQKLNFVTEPLGISKWKEKSSVHEKGIEIVGFDYLTKSFYANIYGEFYQQKFFIKVDFPKQNMLLESKCLERGINVKERHPDCYYHEELKKFYEQEIINTVDNFYNNQK